MYMQFNLTEANMILMLTGVKPQPQGDGPMTREKEEEMGRISYRNAVGILMRRAS